MLGAAGVCVYSLATRLFPSHFGGFNLAAYRLFVPIGYWNALGIFAADRVAARPGVAAVGRWQLSTRSAQRVALVVLAPTLYFTFSRGALAGADRRRGGDGRAQPESSALLVTAALVLGVAPTVAVVLAWRSPALTHQTTTLAAASGAGRKLALDLVILALLQAPVAAGYIAVSQRGSAFPVAGAERPGLRSFWLCWVFSPPCLPPTDRRDTLARHAYDSFVSPPTGGTNLNSRLFSLSNNGRTVLWHAAWRQFEAHPVVGSGAGSFGRWWLAHRTISVLRPGRAQPLPADARRARPRRASRSLSSCSACRWWPRSEREGIRSWRRRFGGYVAYLVHAAVDWDWQMPAVTLLALFAGAAIVTAARRREPESRSRSAGRRGSRSQPAPGSPRRPRLWD